MIIGGVSTLSDSEWRAIWESSLNWFAGLDETPGGEEMIRPESDFMPVSEETYIEEWGSEVEFYDLEIAINPDLVIVLDPGGGSGGIS